jgi:hypothetical protein
MRRPTRRRRPGTRGARLVGFATVVQVIPGTAAPCPDTAGRRRPAAADDPERAPPRTDRAQEPVPGLAAADRAAHRPRQHLPGRHLGQRRGRRRQNRPLPRRTAPPRRRRCGSELAIVATGRSILVIAWHLLSNPRRRFRDLGPGFYAARIDPNAACATTSASPKPSATPSPSSPLSDPTAHSTPAPLTSAGSRHLPTNSPISD